MKTFCFKWKHTKIKLLLSPFFCPPPGEEDLGCDADHPAGHDGAGRLRRLPELHPQPVLRVGQVQRVGRLLEQTQSGQETSQPAGDGALLLHCEKVEEPNVHT